MATRTILCDKSGNPVADIDASLSCAWILNEYGKAVITLSTADAKCRREFINFGNYVYIEHDKLPSWGGVIYTPRSWTDESVTINAYSGERILEWRRGAMEVTMKGTPGQIFKEIINVANNAGYTRISLNEIYEGGTSIEETANLTKMYEVVRKIVDKSGNDFTIEPYIDNANKLNFRANWYKRKGTIEAIVLEEGFNIRKTSTPLVEQGDIVNHLIGYGYGATAKERIDVEISDSESIGDYGLFQGSVSFADIKERSTLLANTEQELAKKKQPRKTLTITALDVGDLFYHLNIGNIFPIKLKSVGFFGGSFGMETTVRILAMQERKTEGECDLVVDEVIL